LEYKLSVIAKNSSPNASPVQLSVVSCSLSVVKLSPITNYQLPNYQITKLLKMPNQLMYQQDDFVVLETNQPEQFLTVAELLIKLEKTLSQIAFADLPLDVQKFESVSEQAQYLLDTSCNLDVGPGEYLQWYAVRLEK
jgi:hypothetical protein